MPRAIDRRGRCQLLRHVCAGRLEPAAADLRRCDSRRPGRLVDLLALACSTLLAVWVFVIGDAGRIGNVSGAYVIGALLLLAVVARVLVAVGRNLSAVMLVIGAVGVLVSDILQPPWPGRLSESGFVMLYLACGAAAPHPSMVRLTEPVAPALGDAAGHLGRHPAGRSAD